MKLYILIETGDQSDLAGATPYFSRVAGTVWSREEAEKRKRELEAKDDEERETKGNAPFYYSIEEYIMRLACRPRNLLPAQQIDP